MIALYRGKSLISKAIKWRTWTPYSHASWITAAGEEYEAWPKGGGVQMLTDWGANHTPGTPVDLFRIHNLDGYQRRAIQEFLMAQVGKPYDFGGVWGFMDRDDKDHNPDKWFCSELVFAACRAADVSIFRRVAAHRVSPGMLAYSPVLDYADRVYAS